jgi:uncharacterized hydrophobic protein (TIGR00271 family)
MLHVRVACPAELTARVTALLAATPGVLNLTVLPATVLPATVLPAAVLPAAARDPSGDCVQFDLAASAANRVLRQLRALQPSPPAAAPGAGPAGLGPIAVQTVDAMIGPGEPGQPGQPARRLLQRGTYHGDTEPVWDLVAARIASESVYAPSFFALLLLAGLIGAIGILTNSSILIVGAMVVGPEYSAIIAVAQGIERRDRAAVRRGTQALLAGFLLAVIATLLFGLVIRWSGDVPDAYRRGIRPVSEFINNPDLFSVITAVLAGIVGVVSLTEARAGALIGVFISVTTIPAAAELGLSIAFQHWRDAAGSAEQLLLNVILLIAVGALSLRAQRLFWRTRSPPAPP